MTWADPECFYRRANNFLEGGARTIGELPSVQEYGTTYIGMI